MTKKNVCINCPKYCHKNDSKAFLKLLQEDIDDGFKEIIFSCDFCRKIISDLNIKNNLVKKFKTVKIGIKNKENCIKYIN